MRWPNGGPPKLYVVVDNETGELIVFKRFVERAARFKKRYEQDLNCTLLTYVQEGTRG